MFAADTSFPHRVLVVDDEPNIVDVITMALRYQGFETASAGSGQEALAGVQSFRSQGIVLDAMLPDRWASRSRSGSGPDAATSRSSS